VAEEAKEEEEAGVKAEEMDEVEEGMDGAEVEVRN
jgi:hypothetical protein